MEISIIVALAENNVIGSNNQLIWHLPNDLKRFKSITTNHTVVMGRKTFDSIGKPLPNRRNIVLSRDKKWSQSNVQTFYSVSSVLEYLKNEEHVYIIGGSEIYNLFLPITNNLEITRVHHHYNGDAFFPQIKETEWEKTFEEKHYADNKHEVDYSFLSYARINK